MKSGVLVHITEAERAKRLDDIKYLVREWPFDYGEHVYNRVARGWFTDLDLETHIRTATSINQVEVDEQKTAVDGCKYEIISRDSKGKLLYTCGKIIERHGLRMYYFITARRHRKDPRKK